MTTDETYFEDDDIESITEVTTKMLEPYWPFLKKQSARYDHPITLDFDTIDQANFRLLLVDGLKAAVANLITVGMCSQLERLKTLPMGEIPEATDKVKRSLEQLHEWSDLYEKAEFTLVNELMLRARMLGRSWAWIGEALGMSAQGAYRKASAHARMLDKDEPSAEDEPSAT